MSPPHFEGGGDLEHDRICTSGSSPLVSTTCKYRTISDWAPAKRDRRVLEVGLEPNKCREFFCQFHTLDAYMHRRTSAEFSESRERDQELASRRRRGRDRHLVHFTPHFLYSMMRARSSDPTATQKVKARTRDCGQQGWRPEAVEGI